MQHKTRALSGKVAPARVAIEEAVSDVDVSRTHHAAIPRVRPKECVFSQRRRHPLPTGAHKGGVCVCVCVCASTRADSRGNDKHTNSTPARAENLLLLGWLTSAACTANAASIRINSCCGTGVVSSNTINIQAGRGFRFCRGGVGTKVRL